MTAPMLMTDCPTEETLAAYIDDRLDAPTRRKVTEHVSSCGDCRDSVLTATDFQMSEAPANLVRGKFGWIATAAGLAAAAVLIVLVLPSDGSRHWYSSIQRTARPTLDYWARIFGMAPSMVPAESLDDVIEASETLSNRPALGRLAGNFPYREPPRTYRGAGDEELDVAKAKLYALALELEDAKSADLRRRGVTKLLIAETKSDLEGAVRDLEAAHSNARNEERDAVAIDLGAALLAYDRWTNDKTSAEHALALSTDVWARKKTPAAAWNRAVALEALDKRNEATAAWGDYLQVDSTSPWAEEARRRQSDLNADP